MRPTVSTSSRMASWIERLKSSLATAAALVPSVSGRSHPRSFPVLALSVGVVSTCGGRVTPEDNPADAARFGGAPAEASHDVSRDAGAAGTAGAEAAGGASRSGWGSPVVCPDGEIVAVRRPACGNGELEPPEACDDGNVVADDGCSSRCRIELGYSCLNPGFACTRCGDCVLDRDEACDDGNTENGDGCSEQCQVEPRYLCEPNQACVYVGICGDSQVGYPYERCDDGNTLSADGCSGDCLVVEPGYLCAESGFSCERYALAHPHCGDGIVQPEMGEQCDDGFNDGRAHGCSVDCRVPYCGDGQVQREWGEACDDGTNDGAYGACHPDCRLSLPVAPPDCSVLSPYCGDGVVQDEYEECDQGAGNSIGGECSPECELASGGYCGDGILDAGSEECDDGNWTSCEGCTALCQIEYGGES